MPKINWNRVIVATIVVAIFYFIADGLVHGGLLGPDYEQAMKNAGYKVEQNPIAYAYFAIFDLGKALIAMLIYAASRPRFGPGVKTALFAGLLTWLGVEALPALAQMPFPFFGQTLLWKVIGYELVPMLLGAILGGWIYKED
jgi:hypothetical protein